MAQTFDINVRLQIQGPNNITPVVNSIRRQLSGLSSAVDIRVSPAASRGVAAATASVNNLAASLASVQAASRQVTASMKGVGLPPSSAQSVQDLNVRAAAAVRQIQAMQKATGGASSEMFKFGEQIGLAFRRFLAFQIGAIVGISKLISSLGSAAREAAEFQKTMVGLSQLGSSTAEIGGISAAISDLSRNLGVSSKELSQATIYLKGAGMSADEVRAALEALAKTSLSPTFDSIGDTTEAIIAMRQQFGVGAGEYEKYLGSINQVSKEFAAESEDLVTAIRKAGGAFKAASSDAQSSAQTFQQFIALFTAVRSTTRESADEIASGLRTIFGRLQSSQVIDNLRGMNIELRHTAEEASLAGKDIQGQFVGGFEAVKRLHEALKDVPTTSPQYAEIVKQVGGFRQVSRVLPLIQQFPLALKAYATAQTGANSLTDDATKAQGALLTRLTKLREEFVGLIRDVGNDKAFQRIGNTFLTLAETLLKLAKAAEPILPLLTAIAGVKIGKALYNFVIPGTQRGVTNVGGARAHAYSPTKKLRSGGPVYGHGIGDKVPDMLPPGSFVIKKSSVEAAGGHGVVRSWIGGGRGSDDRRHDIPVLLEPGEHKVMPHEAKKVGYGNLHRLNKTGNLPRVRGYAEGGIATDDGENEIRIYAWNEYEKVKHVNEKSTVAERAQAWSAYEKLADFGLNSYDENRVPRIPPPPFPRPQKKGTTRSKSQPARQKTEKIIIPRSVQKTLDRSGLSEINFNRSVGEFRFDTPEEVDRIAGSPARGVFDPIGNRVILRKSSGPDVVAHELTHSIDHSQGIYVPEEFASENADHPFGRAAVVAKDYFYTHPKSAQYVQSRTDTPPEYLAIAVGDYALRRHDNPDTFREALSAHPHGASVLRAVEDLFIPAAEKFYPRQRYASGGSVKRRYGFASGGLIPSIPATASSGVGATRKSLSREEIRRRYGFAGGGSVSPLAASGKITDPAVRKNFEALFAGEHASRVSDHIPGGSTFLAHGRDAVAFRRPDGDVVRVGGLGDEKFRAHDRPTDPDLMIQPKVSARYGDHLVEQLPYAPSLREQFGERFDDPAVIKRVWKAFDRRARRRGKMAIDAHPGNLTYVKGVKGRLMAIDPRTYADRPTGNEPTVDMPPISAGLSPAPMGYARGGYVDLSRHPEERARRFMSKLRDTHIGSADEPTIRLASHYVNSSNPFNDPEHPLYDERRNDKLDRFLRSRRLPGAMVLHRGLSGEALQKWTGQWRPGKLAGSVASTGSRFTSTALLDKETASFGSLQLRINAAKGTPGALVNPHESEFLLPRHTNLRFGEFDRERNILHADIAHGYASGGVVMTPNGPVATSRDGITYQLDRDALLQGRRKPKNGTVQGVRLRRVEADPSTGALTPRANWYGKHRARRYARRLMGGMTAGGVVNSVRIGTPHPLQVKSRIMGSFHARGYAAGTDLGGLKDVPFGELAHWLQDYLDRDVLKHPAYKGQRGEVREATGLKPIPKKRVPYALAENLGYQYKKNEKIANRNLGNVDLSDEGQAKLAEIVGRAQLGGIDPFELAKVRQPKGRAASKAKAMRAATPPSPEVTSLIEAVSGLDDLDAMKELYRSDKNIIRTVSPLAKKITRDKLSAGEKREAYAQRKDQYAYLKDAYKKRIAELKARGDQYNRPVKSSVLVTGEDLPSSRQAGIAAPSRVSDAGNRALKKVMAPAIVREGKSTPPLFKDVQDPETISAMVHTAGQRKGAPRPMTVAEADSLGEQYQQPQATPQVREGIRLKRRTTASQPTTSRTVDPTVVAEYRRRKAEEAEKYAELQRTAAAVREKVGGSSPLDIEGVRTYTKNVAYEQRKAATAQELARPYTPEEITAGKRSAASQQTPNRSPTPLIEQYYRSRQPDGPEGKYPVPAVISQRAKRSIFRGYPIAEPRPDVVRTSEGAIPLPGRTPLVTRTVRFGAGKMSRSSEERAVLRGAVLPYQLKRLAERHRPRAATPTPAPTPAPTPHVHETRPTEPVAASAADAFTAPSPTAMAAKTRTVQSRAARSTAAGAGGSKPPRQPRTRAGGAEPPGGDGTNREILAVLKSLLAETKGVRSSAKSTADNTKKKARTVESVPTNVVPAPSLGPTAVEQEQEAYLRGRPFRTRHGSAFGEMLAGRMDTDKFRTPLVPQERLVPLDDTPHRRRTESISTNPSVTLDPIDSSVHGRRQGMAPLRPIADDVRALPVAPTQPPANDEAWRGVLEEVERRGRYHSIRGAMQQVERTGRPPRPPGNTIPVYRVGDVGTTGRKADVRSGNRVLATGHSQDVYDVLPGIDQTHYVHDLGFAGRRAFRDIEQTGRPLRPLGDVAFNLPPVHRRSDTPEVDASRREDRSLPLGSFSYTAIDRATGKSSRRHLRGHTEEDVVGQAMMRGQSALDVRKMKGTIDERSFHVDTVDAMGKQVKLTLTAYSEEMAKKIARDRGLFVSRIRQATTRTPNELTQHERAVGRGDAAALERQARSTTTPQDDMRKATESLRRIYEEKIAATPRGKDMDQADIRRKADTLVNRDLRRGKGDVRGRVTSLIGRDETDPDVVAQKVRAATHASSLRDELTSHFLGREDEENAARKRQSRGYGYRKYRFFGKRINDDELATMTDEGARRERASLRTEAAISGGQRIYRDRSGGIKRVGTDQSLLSRIANVKVGPQGGFLSRTEDGIRNALKRGRETARTRFEGGGAHAANLGFFASAFAPQILEQSYGTVDQPKGSVEQAKRGQAIGGALTYGGIGAQVGSTLGLPGAAVGLGVGAVYGFVAALKEAENRIEEIKFDKSLNSLRASLESAASGAEKLGDTTNQVVSSLLATSTGEAKRRTDVEGAGKNSFQRFFESVGGDPHKYDVFGLYTKSTEEAERDIGTQRGAKRAEILTPQLPQLQQIGERIASEVRLGSHEVTLPEGANQATIAARRESRIKSFQGAGGAQIAETISEIQHIPLRQVYENFDRIAVSANRLRVQQEGQTKVVTAATIEMVRFQEVGDAVRGAADSLHGLQAVSSGLASVFEGQIATAKVGGFSGAASNVGGLDREAFRKSVQFTTGQVGGASINEFGGVITDIDRAMRELPQAITHAPLNFGDADALKGGLAKVFKGGEGGVGGLNLPQSMLTRLSDAVEAMDPERLLKETKGNPGKLAEELIKESFGDLPRAFADITKQVEERGGQFAEGLATFSQMLQKAGESRDLEGRAQLGVTQARAALAGSREGRAPEDLVTLRQIQEPIRQRQERLAGGDAFNPEAIGGKLAVARNDVVAIQERINNVQDEPADQNDPTKRRNTLNSLLKEFNTASLKASNLQRALEHLADASDRSATIQEKLNQVEKQRQGQLSYTEKLLTADPRQLFEMQRGAQAADVAVGQGGFDGFSAENVQSALEHLRSLENVRLPGYGNRTGGQVAERLIGGANREVFGDQAAGLERDRDSLLQQQVKIAQEAATAQKQLSDHFASTARSFLDNLEGQNRQFLARMDTLIHEASLRDAKGAEGRAEVTARGTVHAVAKIEDLQNLTSTDLPTIKKITSAPEFGAYRESGQRIKAVEQARAKLLGDRGDNGELGQEAARNPGFAFGRQFQQITRGDPNSQGATDRLREELYASASNISRRTEGALTPEDVVRQVIPLVMDKVQKFQENRNPNSAKSLNVPGVLRNAIDQSLKVVQGAEQERFNSAERATGVHAFGVTEGTRGPAKEALKRVSDNFDEINKSIGELPKNIRDLGDAVRDAGGAINKAMRTRKTREEVEQSQPPQVAETRASGGSIFRKRGTDTVPAMLTPGEFVVNAASTRKHLPMLRRINAGARYYADGGDVEDPFRKDVESFRPTEPIVPDIHATTMTAPTQVGEDIVRHQSEEAEYIRKRIAEIWGTPMRARTTPAEVQAPANVVGEEPRRSPTPDSPPTPPTPPTPPQAIPPALPQVPSLPDAIASIPSPTTPGLRRKHSEEVLVPALGRAVAADREASEAKRQDALASARQYDERRKAKRAENMMGVEAIPSIVVPKISPRESKGESVSYGRKDNAYFADLERNIGLANQQETPFSRSALANAEKAAVVLDRKIERYQRAGMTRHAEKASGLLASLGRSNIYNALEQERSSRKSLGGPTLSQVQSPSRATVREEQDYQSRRTSFLAGVGGGTQVSYVASRKPRKSPIGLTRSQHRAMQAMVFGPEMTNTRTPRVNTALSGGGLVPSMVSPGEFVVNARSARANAGVLSQINAGTPEYHQAGGVVGGSVAGVAAPGIHLSSGVKSTLDGFTSRFSDAVSGLGGSLGRLSSSAASLAGSLGGFNDAASSLARALSSVSIPSKIEVSSRNEVVVTLNGGAVIAAIKGDTATAVMEAIQQQLPEQVRKIVDSLPPRA